MWRIGTGARSVRPSGVRAHSAPAVGRVAAHQAAGLLFKQRNSPTAERCSAGDAAWQPYREVATGSTGQPRRSELDLGNQRAMVGHGKKRVGVRRELRPQRASVLFDRHLECRPDRGRESFGHEHVVQTHGVAAAQAFAGRQHSHLADALPRCRGHGRGTDSFQWWAPFFCRPTHGSS